MRLFILLFLFGVSACASLGTPSPREQLHQQQLALESFHDFEIARTASASILLELEALHRLEPEDETLLLDLVRGWVLHTELFTLDALEAARVREDEAAAMYQAGRVRSGYTRASYWAREWLSQRAPGLSLEAPEAALSSALNEAFTSADDAAALLWTGHALLGVQLSASGSAAPARSVAHLFLERSVQLDGTVHFASAHALLGRYQSSRAEPNLEQSRKHFARAEALAGTNYLLTQLYQAISHDCREGNLSQVSATLNEVLRTGDPNPRARLQNAAAKRRARRHSQHPKLCTSSLTSPGP